MATSFSGTVGVIANTGLTYPAVGTYLPAYTIPLFANAVTTYANGTAANQAAKIALVSGSLASTTVSFDLSLTSAGAGAVQCTDGTYGFSSVRDWIIINGASTNQFFLKIDLTIANAFGPHATPGAGFFEGTMTTVKLDLHASCSFRFSKAGDTSGVAVDSTHKAITLDSGSNTVAYSMIIIGN